MNSWGEVLWCLIGCIIGIVISTAADWHYVSGAMHKVAQCQAELANPEHCIPYCEAAWQDFGC